MSIRNSHISDKIFWSSDPVRSSASNFQSVSERKTFLLLAKGSDVMLTSYGKLQSGCKSYHVCFYILVKM